MQCSMLVLPLAVCYENFFLPMVGWLGMKRHQQKYNKEQLKNCDLFVEYWILLSVIVLLQKSLTAQDDFMPRKCDGHW